MRLTRVAAVFFAVLFFAVLLASAAETPLPDPKEAPLPELKVEATGGGSVLRIRNVAAQPLTAYLVELADYPGSSFALYQEDIGGQALAPGAERKVSITNMMVGAAPEYVKLQAALYADGSAAGSPGKVAQLAGLRRTRLGTTRELIARLEKGMGGSKAALVAGLREWAQSLPAPARSERGTPAALANYTVRELIHARADELEKGSVERLLASLKESERALASSKPAL